MSYEAVAEMVRRFGADRRKLLAAISQIVAGPSSIDELVAHTALSRRTIEEVVRSAGGDLEAVGHKFELATGVHEKYRRLLGPARSAAEPNGLEVVRSAIARVPETLARLDHVQATPESVWARALWLRERFDLSDAVVVFVGDHDLTSVALAVAEPTARIAVVDIDERLLEFLGVELAKHGVAFDLRFSDLRFGLPIDLLQSSDLFVTDPPYTADGVGLFVGRGIESLRDLNSGRGLLAYGYGDQLPGLGYKVQRRLSDFNLVFEEIIPDFGRYDGAQAVGSSSDWYVLRPTSSTKKSVARVLKNTVSAIYSRGADATGAERRVAAESDELVGKVLSKLGVPPEDACWLGQTGIEGLPNARVRRESLVSGDPDSAAPRLGQGDTAILDIRDDPGFWLFRALLNADCAHLVALVDNNHPDIVDERSQRRLQEDLESKYQIRFMRSFPSNRSAVVSAIRVPKKGIAAKSLHKAKNALRESLIASRSTSSNPLTKSQAREVIAPHLDALGVGEAVVGQLPRFAIRRMQALLDGHQA